MAKPVTLATPRSASAGVALPVMERFYTLQGEGAHAGRAAFFIRLGGCDVGCHWCDVKESWPADAHPVADVETLADEAEAAGTQVVVITGGEPTLHNLAPLTEALHARGLRAHLETAGTNPLTGDFDWITFSPKKFRAPLDEYYARAHELKVVVFNRHDLAWAETHARRMNPDALLLLQPEWSRHEEALGWIIEHVKANPCFRVSLQTHKFMRIP